MIKTYKIEATHKISGEKKTAYSTLFMDAVWIGTNYQRKGYSVTIYTYNKETRKYEVK